MSVEVADIEIELDLNVDHRPRVPRRESEAGFALYDGRAVAGFYRRFADTLTRLGARVRLRTC